MASYPRLEKNPSQDLRSAVNHRENTLSVGKGAFPSFLWHRPLSPNVMHTLEQAKAFAKRREGGR